MKTLSENCNMLQPHRWVGEWLLTALEERVAPGWFVRVQRPPKQERTHAVSVHREEPFLQVTVYVDEREKLTLDEAVRAIEARLRESLDGYLANPTYPFGELIKETVT